MADETLSFELVTPLKKFEGRGVKEILATAENGEMGILPGHDVMILSLGTGPLVVQYPDREDHYFVSGGFIQIDHNQVRILAEICEAKTEIDVERAKKAKERAEKRMLGSTEDVDWLRAEAALKRAVNRIGVAETH